MAWTQADLTALDEAIASGVLKVAYRDKTVTYHSLADMLRLRAVMKEEIDAGTSSAVDRYARAAFSRE